MDYVQLAKMQLDEAEANYLKAPKKKRGQFKKALKRAQRAYKSALKRGQKAQRQGQRQDSRYGRVAERQYGKTSRTGERQYGRTARTVERQQPENVAARQKTMGKFWDFGGKLAEEVGDMYAKGQDVKAFGMTGSDDYSDYTGAIGGGSGEPPSIRMPDDTQEDEEGGIMDSEWFIPGIIGAGALGYFLLSNDKKGK